MEKQEAITFLFNIAKEIKRSFESPVIFVTSKDYADGIYRSLVDIRAALQRNAPTDEIAGIVNNFHLDWLRAVREIEEFKKRIKDMPRDVIQNAIDFTIKCVHHRYANFKNFQHNLKLKMTIEDRLIMQADLEIMKDMKESVITILQEKKTCFLYNADQVEYLVKLNYEIEELLNWLDRLNDSLAIQFCRVVNIHVPQLPSDLTKTLKQIIDEVAVPNDPKAVRIVEKIESKGKLLSSMVRVNATHDLEVSKVIEKIKVLEDRIERLKEEDSSAVLALQHKVIYLEERLASLENLKQCLNALKREHSKEIDEDDVLESTELHIFNHNLPHVDRGRLVERLVKLWDVAVSGDGTGKSIISILSAADLKEVYTDDVGQFTVDEYGRKLYASESTNTLYQLNERNELVPVNDDDKHVYFYDDCGRYYLSESRTRIYKAHDDASEYELCAAGKLLKLKETIDGIEYKYDINGRYYINEQGNRIYCDLNTGEKYQLDGFGNLVRVISTDSVCKPCPDEPMVVKECKYLQREVGDALKQCLANVLLLQPADPIGCLADSLVKYWKNIEDRQRRLDEKRELAAEREYHETVSVPQHSYVTEEESSRSSLDYNLSNYKSLDPED